MSLQQVDYAAFAPLQKRTLKVLALAQIFSGLGSGAVISVGALLAVKLSGNESWGGSMTTVMTLGSALAAMPLARYAASKGRRIALVTGIAIAWMGTMLAILSAVLGAFPLLLAGGALIGVGSAVNLQARFAATDLAAPEHRSRDLSLVVWTTTVGSVAGPNLLGVGDSLGQAMNLPQYAGIFVISAVGMAASALVLFFGLNPDPSLELAKASAASGSAPGGPAAPPRRPSLRESWKVIRANQAARAGLVAIICGHAIMVSVMSVTSVHMDNHGASLQLIGFTISLHVVGMYAFSPFAGMLSDKIGAPGAMVTGGAVLLASLGFAGFGAENQTLVTIGLFLLGLGWSIATIAGAGHIAANVSAEDRLAVQGASDTLMSLAGALGGLVAGIALALVGYQGLNAVAAVVAVILIMVTLTLHRHTPKDSARELENV
ncbi:MFS transporter [Timonella senegalensis]|uniref:MFS transporter n=1 Tax=Timonella senegalensis TaxID=1465825 RepID=UPI0028A87449|nr:MFS transporter [Timonella senegalensis]